MEDATRIKLTRHYAAALAAAALMVLAAMPLQAPSLALAGILLGVVVALGARVPPKPRLRANAVISTPTPVEEDTVSVQVNIENGGHRAIFGEWRVELPGPCSVDSGESAGYRYLARGEHHTIPIGLCFHLFGLQRVGPVHLRLEDPFGFTVLEGAFGAPHSVRVFPRRDPLRHLAFRARQKRTVRGAYEVSQPGTGFEFFGLRGYVHGDRPRDVNWKASARVGSIIVNQHQKETDAEIVLLVDARLTTGWGRLTMTPFAQGCRGALAIAEAHLRARDAVRLVAYGDGIREDRHTGATRRLKGVLDLVVELEPAGETLLAEVVQRIMPSLRPRSPIMLFSPLVGDPTIPDAVSSLITRDHPVRAIVPRYDWTSQTPALRRIDGDAQQALEFARLRRTGVPATLHAPGTLLAQSLANLEVVAS